MSAARKQVLAETMRQIEATGFPKLGAKERQKLDVWAEDDGWCSACGKGLHWGEPPRVVHIGSQKKNINVALCISCLAKMTAVGSPAGGDPK